MATKQQTCRAMMESMVSSFIVILSAKTGEELSKTDTDTRNKVREGLEGLIDGFESDTTSWYFVKDRMLYDVYLQMRQEEGTITKTDLTRTGLTVANFADPGEWSEHNTRVSTYKANQPTELKLCSQCGLEKSITKFKKRGGSKCNACRSKEYRDRKLNEK